MVEMMAGKKVGQKDENLVEQKGQRMEATKVVYLVG
jgi:hypothetical protein